ncbi:MAG: DUF1987 domain-containing protein [Flavobacteriales bacterium]|nr:DUF1987 domain-containing protein [Flavobacteriales bacterium]
MDALLIEGKMTSPAIDFQAGKTLRITGRSIPEHPVKFYQPVDEWLAKYILTQPHNLELFIHLDYLNTHSTECVLILFKKLEAYNKQTVNRVKVTWGFDEDDEDMQILGEDLSTMVEVPFDIVEIKG